MNSFFFFQFTYSILLFILFLFTSVILGVVKIGGPWTRSMKVVHGPGPQRGSMDQGSMFCTFPREEAIEIHIRCYASLKDSNNMVAFNYLIIVWDIFTCRHKF